MYVQGVDRVFDLNFNGREDARKLTYGDVFLQAEQEYSRYNFEFADTDMLLAHFRDAEKECKALLDAGAPSMGSDPLPEPSSHIAVGAPRGLTPPRRHKLALPAYDQCIKASHIFNLLDARGVISVTERQSYILRVRELAKACCAAWLQTEGGGAWCHPGACHRDPASRDRRRKLRDGSRAQGPG
jgi:glycyl-tRNA synthetase alpha chain